MKKRMILAACLAAACSLPALAVPSGGEDAPPPLILGDPQAVLADLDAIVPGLLERARVPGLQVAIIREGRIAGHRSYGVRNAESREPVDDGTIFEAASLTKPFFAYYVMKLADQGLIDLDTPLLGLVPDDWVREGLGHPLDEKGFHRDWAERITPRQVLSHSSGMPHGERSTPYPLFFEPGTKWKYSADGYDFLQKAVEILKGDRLENLMRKEVLEPLGMSRSSLVWKDDYERTMANGHTFFVRPQEFRRRRESHAAATLYTTAEDYAKFVCAVLNGEGLGPGTLKTMLAPQIDMDKERGLGWGLGFGTQTDANGLGVWQWGDYGIFRNYILAYPAEKAGVVYLTNSFHGLAIAREMVGHGLGGRAMGSIALNYRPWDAPVHRLAWELSEKGPQAIGRLKELRAGDPAAFDRGNLTYLGAMLREDGLTPQLIALIEFVLEENPRSGAVRLELAQACLAAKDWGKALTHLTKVRDAEEDKVDPRLVDWNLEYANTMMRPFPTAPADLAGLAGDYGARRVRFSDGKLSYKREGGTFPDFRPLVPFSADTFMLEGLPSFRLKFEFDGSGNPVKAVALYEDGRRDETKREN